MFGVAALGEAITFIQFVVDYWWLLLIAVAVVFFLIMAAVKRGFTALLWVLWQGIKYLAIGLFYVIASPVLLIMWLTGRKEG